MNPIKVANTIRRYESGLLSPAEVANSLLFDMVSGPILDVELISFLGSLPLEVRQQISSLMRRIEEADFQWGPFFLLMARSPAHDSAQISTNLRQVRALLDGVAPPRQGMRETIEAGRPPLR